MALQSIRQPRSWISTSSGGRGSTRRVRASAAHNEWNHIGIALAAMEEGFFAREGLTDVEIISFPEEQGELLDREAMQVDLLARGVVDIGIDPRTTFVLEANAEGKPVAIVAARRKNHAFVFVGQKGIQTLEDLRGKTLDTGHPGGASDVMTRQLLKDHGFEPDKDVYFAYKGGPMHDPAGSFKAFLEGKLGPAKLTMPEEAEKLAKAGFNILLDLRKHYPSRHDRVTAANTNFVREHPDLLKGFLKGMISGCRFVLDPKNRERFAEILQGAGFLTEEREHRSFDALINGWQERVSRDLSLPLDAIELITGEQKRANRLAASFKTADALRLDELQKAQSELGAA